MSRHPNRRHPSHERWLISYADFITLLFALFVVLYAASKADQEKQKMVADSINSAFNTLGLFPTAMGKPSRSATGTGTDGKPVVAINSAMGEDVRSPAQVEEDLEHIRRELEQALSSQVATHAVSIHMGRDGLVISLREAGFFASGSATPKPETLSTLRQIAALLGHTPYDLRVEGHTDDIPIHTAEFDSNWELSAARATRMARLFLELQAMTADRLSAAGYAQYHPVAPNDTAEGRSENRRVDLVVLPRSSVALAGPPPMQPSGAWRRIAVGR
jgi:chemotaxis protein MotB